MRRELADYTYEDLRAAPEDGTRWEIIDGELVVTPSPFTRHQRIAASIFVDLAEHVRVRKLGEVLFAPLDVILSDKDVVQPDLVFVSKRRRSILKRQGIVGAPDLVVEIVSKGTRSRDKGRKRGLYQDHGVKHAWVVDPFARTLDESILVRGRYETRSLRGKARFEPACFPGLTIDLAKIWALR